MHDHRLCRSRWRNQTAAEGIRRLPGLFFAPAGGSCPAYAGLRVAVEMPSGGARHGIA
ncbi:hypothetical protein BSTEL_1321 [Bifidobacterium stellenboschense]|uniref:Uncharacterized protein n=1 Tax=Bifidobacterium stellenboschense TaxID=762211 RepID=A0A087DTE6_9BIFI|nr:hypothetical protein BSTEL_1321 [Bifidobacterium stellenboschense]